MQGELIIGTDLNTDKFDKKIEKLEQRYKKQDVALKIKSDSIDDANRKLDEYSNKLRKVSKEQVEVSSQLKAKKTQYGFIDEKINAGQAVTPQEYEAHGKLSNDIAELTARQQQLNKEQEKYNALTDKAYNNVEKLKLQQVLIKDSMKQTNIEIQRTRFDQQQAQLKDMNKNIGKINSNINDVNKSINKIGGGLGKVVKSVAKWALAIFGIRSMYLGIRQAMSTLSQYDETLKSNVDYIKYALATALKPIIEWIVNAVYKILSVIGYILKAIFGINIFAKANTKEFMAANNQAKKLQRTLAGFDEMNVVSDNSDNNGGTVSPTFDLSSFDDVGSKLKGIIDKIKKMLEKVWNSAPVQAYVNMVKTKFKFMYDFITQVGGHILESFKLTWDNISENVKTAIDNIFSFLTQFWTDISLGIETWGPVIIESVNGLFDSIWQIIDPFIQLITQAWADFTGIIKDLWDKYGADIVNKIGEFINNTINLFKKLYDSIIAPIVKPMIETMQKLWDEHIKGMLESVGEFVMKLINFALDIYNHVIAPIVSWLMETLKPVFEWVGQRISDTVGRIVGFISDKFRRIMDIFSGLIDFITGVFSGNWEQAWNGVVQIFENIVSGLYEIIKFPLNLIIDGVNTFIKGLNKVQVPDWVPLVGGKGINIPLIPRLAKGGIINMPNQGVAIGGESGPEGVIPLTDSEQMSLLGEAIGRYITVNLTNITELDGRQIARKVTEINESTNFLLNR